MTTPLHSPVCDLLGCRYPLVLAGMGGVARDELIAMVTRAGASVSWAWCASRSN